MAKTFSPRGFDLTTFGLNSIGGETQVPNLLNEGLPGSVPDSQFVPQAQGGNFVSNDRQLLSRDQIEAEYGLTRRWLELAAHQGQGPPMLRLSRRMVRYRRADFEAWLAAHIIDNSAE